MGARNITEDTVILIQDHIKANIASALAAVRTARNDQLVPTPPPQSESYFIYESPNAYRAPAILTVPRHVDFRLDRGQNHINAIVDFVVSAVVENRTKELLSYQSWRYQDALYQILSGAEIVSVDRNVKLVIKVLGIDFSSIFFNETDNTIFRKEIALTCAVEHWENEN